MSEHTPGPWTIVGEKDLPKIDDLMIVASQVGSDAEDEGLYVCNIGTELAAVVGYPDAVSATNLANARMIAAAPDLFSLCEELLAYIQGVSPDSIGGPMWRRAVGIIAKATKGDQ